jgi:branched-chain amino acid transport system substrate-binding protein
MDGATRVKSAYMMVTDHGPDIDAEAAFQKERAINPIKTQVMGQLEITDEHALTSIGVAVSIITAGQYDYNHHSELNDEFVAAYKAEFGRDFFSVGGYDGMHLIDVALQKSGGKTDADAKGASWESARGRISIDPQTCDIVQTVYIRRVEKRRSPVSWSTPKSSLLPTSRIPSRQ